MSTGEHWGPMIHVWSAYNWSELHFFPGSPFRDDMGLSSLQ